MHFQMRTNQFLKHSMRCRCYQSGIHERTRPSNLEIQAKQNKSVSKDREQRSQDPFLASLDVSDTDSTTALSDVTTNVATTDAATDEVATTDSVGTTAFTPDVVEPTTSIDVTTGDVVVATTADVVVATTDDAVVTTADSVDVTTPIVDVTTDAGVTISTDVPSEESVTEPAIATTTVSFGNYRDENDLAKFDDLIL